MQKQYSGKGKHKFSQNNKGKQDGENNIGDVKEKFPPCKDCKNNTFGKALLLMVDS